MASKTLVARDFARMDGTSEKSVCWDGAKCLQGKTVGVCKRAFIFFNVITMYHYFHAGGSGCFLLAAAS